MRHSRQSFTAVKSQFHGISNIYKNDMYAFRNCFESYRTKPVESPLATEEMER